MIRIYKKDHSRPSDVLQNFLVSPSILIILLSFFAVLVAIPNNSFWADDFGNIRAFNSQLGTWDDFTVNAGRPVLNLFFYVMGVSFGTGSATPYLIASSLVVICGLIMVFMAAVSLRIISFRMSIFIAAILMSSTTLFPIFLWSTNITHGASILCLGIFAWLFSKNFQLGEKTQPSILWEAFWVFLIIFCNPLYIGIIILFSTLTLLVRIQKYGFDGEFTKQIYFAYATISMILPILYFFTVSQPEQKKNLSYANTSLTNILPNLEFYLGGFLTTQFLLFFTISLLLLMLKFFQITAVDLVLIASAGSILLPVLIQSNQRVLNYLVLPLLFLGFFLARILDRCLSKRSILNVLVYIIIFMLPCLIFSTTKNTRSWYIEPGLGSETKLLIEQIRSFTPPGTKLCIDFKMNKQDEIFLVGGFSGESAFAISPIFSPDTQISMYSDCTGDPERLQILIEKIPNGKFFAYLK